jgi:hypothetical protein
MRKALALAAAVLGAYLIVSLVAPRYVPRLAMFPTPAAREWYDGCNWHSRTWQRTGPIWGSEETSTTRYCPARSKP